MTLPLWYSRRSSEALSSAAFEALCAGAEILEQDARGLKVLRLADGNILKLFRVKHLISSARLYSYARQFCRNAERLRVLDIPTVDVLALYHFNDTSDSAVLYRPLPGQTIRQLASAKALDVALLEQLGAFISQLHDRGIYFRSLHMGNIVHTPGGRLGLIDVADMSIYPWRLRCGRRLRNLRHISRLQEDMRQLETAQWDAIWRGYFEGSQVGQRCHDRLAGRLQHLSISLRTAED